MPYVSEAEFAVSEKEMEKKVVLINGVWWHEKRKFHFKPIHEFRKLKKGAIKISLKEGILSYSYQTAPEFTNHYVWHFVFETDRVERFDIKSLPNSSRRASVRKGLRNFVIKPIEDNPLLVEQMRQINISQAKRFHAIGREKRYLPPEYYERNKKEWETYIKKLIHHRGYSFIGAFKEEMLAAYIVVASVEDTLTVVAVKSDTNMMSYCPSDALHFSLIFTCKNTTWCKRIVHGGPKGEPEGLRRFKKSFLFKEERIPYYIGGIAYFLTLLRRE